MLNIKQSEFVEGYVGTFTLMNVKH